jgi:hypothetical protein
MAEVNPPGWMQNRTDHTARIDRMIKSTVVQTPGIVSPGDLAVSQNGSPNMSVNVGGGACYIAGTESTNQGVYYALNEGAVNLTIAAAHATLDRIDLVVAKVQDSFYSGATNAWSLAVVTGTAGSGAPSAPANSLTLAQVAVAHGVSTIVNANITTMSPLAVVGGVDRMTQATTFPAPFVGAMRVDSNEASGPAHVSLWSGGSFKQMSLNIPPVQRIYTAGSYTWNKPDNLLGVHVRVWGAGGGGGGRGATTSGNISLGGGGGGGGYAEGWIPASSLPASVAVAVGTGGAGGNGTADGSTGGNSSFGSFLTGNGGVGGSTSTGAVGTTFQVSGGNGGNGASSGVPNSILISGQEGWTAYNSAAGTGLWQSGQGGNGALGGAGGWGLHPGQTGGGSAGKLPGGGGGGNSGNSTATIGAVGGNGIVVVVEFYG